VRAVFTGHDHNYQRLQHGGMTYIVSGGAGAGLYTMSTSDAANATVLGKSKSYNFVRLHITPDYISGQAYDGVSGNPLINDVTGAAEVFNLYGSPPPPDMGMGGSGGGGGGGAGGGTGGTGGGGGNPDNGGGGGCSIASTASFGTSVMFLFAIAALVVRRRRA
jgi:MYXO-CTERM domain-containing protein